MGDHVGRRFRGYHEPRRICGRSASPHAASHWRVEVEKVSEDEAVGYHQLRAAHQRYTAPDRRLVENKGHGHAMVKHFYRRIGGEWKLGGLKPTIRWNEFEAEQIFRGFEPISSR